MAVDERRKRKRVAVHWPVHLFEPMGKKSVESTTENLSSEGFYCLSSRTFKIGERLRCEIVIPEATLGLDGPIVLECQVAVRRVEDLELWFGLGCHIEDLKVQVMAREKHSRASRPVDSRFDLRTSSSKRIRPGSF